MVTDVIDTTFDFRWDTPRGKDPDTWSPTLLRYHQLLWSKALPNGKSFALEVRKPPPMFLHHLSELGEFWLSSDAVVPAFRYITNIIDQIPKRAHSAFMHIGYTIGGMMVFPANKIDGRMTINGARGFHPSIRDRFDLTVECIRRHYLDEKPNPLRKTLALYNDFFELFVDFAGYVDFFHLQDLVDQTCTTVKFMMPFDNFTTSPVPGSLDAYLEYRQRAIEFIESRNRRIAAYVARARDAITGHNWTVRTKETTGPFAPVLSEGWYGVLLNLGKESPAAISFVAACEHRSDDTEREIRELLRGDRGWRPQLVGCVAALAAGPDDRPLDALLEAACQGSWVSPQILVTTSLLHPPGWETPVEDAILRRQDAKAAAALSALRPPVAGDLAEIASRDRHGGRQIALGWGDSIRDAFDKASLRRTW